MVDRKEAARQIGFGVLGNAVYTAISTIAALAFGWLVALFVSHGEGQPVMTRADWVAYTLGGAVAFVIVLCGALWAWPRIAAILLSIRQPKRSGHAAGASEDGLDAGRFVEFTFPGSWAESGFRHRNLGTDGQHALNAEEVYLRIVAKKAMQNTEVEITVRPHPSALEPLAEIGSAKFVGTVTKGREQTFLILQRKFWYIPATYTNPKTGAQPIDPHYVDKEAIFFPENDRRFFGEIGQTYHFQVKVHHSEGPDIARFAIALTPRRYGPQSNFGHLVNIRPVDK